MNPILIFSLIPVFFVAVNGEVFLPPDPFSVDDIKLDLSKNRPISGDVKKDVKKDEKKDDKKDDKSDKTKPDVQVKASTPIITGSVEKTIVDKAEPTIDSVKTKSDDDSSKKTDDKTEEKSIGKKSSKTTFVDVPEAILKSVEEKATTNLRTETPAKDDKTKIEELDKDKKETKGETESDESKKSETEGEKKDDTIIKSLDGAEKQLSETFGVIKSKLSEPGKVQKPIKVDCGTTRVRVVCSKKNEEAKTETDESSDVKEAEPEKVEEKEPEKTETSSSDETKDDEESE